MMLRLQIAQFDKNLFAKTAKTPEGPLPRTKQNCQIAKLVGLFISVPRVQVQMHFLISPEHAKSWWF